MITIETKLYPTEEQKKEFEHYLSTLKAIWNYGLSLYLEKEQREYRDKDSKRKAKTKPNVPAGLVLEWKPNKNSKGKEQKKVGHIVGAGIQKTKQGHKFCPLRKQFPHIDNIDKAINSAYKFHTIDYDLENGEYIETKKDWVDVVSSDVRNAIIYSTLKKAWSAYKSGIRKKPQFKRKYDKVLSFGSSSGSVATCKVKGNKVQLPKIGWVRCRFSHWQDNYEIREYRVVKKANEFFLQFVVRTEPTDIEYPTDIPDKALGIDIGSTNIFTDHLGRQVKAKRYLKTQDRRLKKLQRKLARQKTKKEERQENLRAIAKQKSDTANLKVVVPDSYQMERTKEAIAKTHNKIARQRKGFNHALSTKIAREYGMVVFEDLNLQNLTRSPHAKQREDGKGYEHNGAKRKAGLNRNLLDNAIGQLRTLIEQKCNSLGRLFLKVEPKFSSQECSQCGHIDSANRPKKPMHVFKCTACGHEDHADRNAAEITLKRGVADFAKDFLYGVILQILSDFPKVFLYQLSNSKINGKNSKRRGKSKSKPTTYPTLEGKDTPEVSTKLETASEIQPSEGMPKGYHVGKRSRKRSALAPSPKQGLQITPKGEQEELHLEI